MRVGEFLEDIGRLTSDWDEELNCACCGAAILELRCRGAAGLSLADERVQWFDGRAAHSDENIVCPHCGCQSPIARPHMRDPLPAG